MRPFESQIRLEKWNVDEAQRRLAELLRLEDGLKGDLARLEAELVTEQETAASSFEASLTYGAYATQLIDRREKLNRSIVEVGGQVVNGREALRDAFAELKKFELAAEAAEARARKLRDRRDQQELDDLGIDIFRRRAD